MGYIPEHELAQARLKAHKAHASYCNQCQTDTPHITGRHFGKAQCAGGNGRTCLICGWAYVHKPVESKPMRRAVFAADNYECVYCGETRRLGIDHIVPQSRGGTNVFENLVTACHWCNSRKKDKNTYSEPTYGRYR